MANFTLEEVFTSFLDSFQDLYPNITLEQLMKFNEKDGAFSKYRFYQQFTKTVQESPRSLAVG